MSTLAERWREEPAYKLFAEDEWSITERMLAGDFNPYHDKTNGQFTFSNGENAVAPIRGKTDNGQRLLNQYKEKHGGKKSDLPGREPDKEPKKEPAWDPEALTVQSDIFTEENLKNLDKLEEELAIARFNETVPENILDEMEGWIRDARKAAAAAKEAAATGKKPSADFESIDHIDAVQMASEMGQTKEQLGDDYTQVTGWKGYFGTSNSFKLNEILRSEDGYDGLNNIDRKTVDAMDRNMAPLPRSIKLQRMVNSEGVLESMKRQGIPTDESCVGKVFYDGGYTSTSFDMDDNVFKWRDMTMHINAPAGTSAFISPNRSLGKRVDESEIVLARSSAFKITGFKKATDEWGDERIDLYVEVVVDDDF